MIPEKKSFILIFLAIPSLSQAESFSKVCSSLEKCIEFVAKETGAKYLYDDSFSKVELKASSNLQIDKTNADLIFTKVLSSNEFARVPVNNKNTYEIIKSKEISRANIKKVNCNVNEKPELDNTWDYYTLSYQFKDYETAKQAPRYIQDFIPREGRVFSVPYGNNIYITASAPVLKKVYAVLVENDQDQLPTSSPSHSSPNNNRIRPNNK